MATCIGSTSLDTAPGTYLYSLAQTSTTFATIGSDDSLRLFDGSLNLLSKALPAHTGISCVTPFDAGFATAGRDSHVHCWDTRCGKSSTSLSDPKSAGISALAAQDHLLATGTESTKEGLADVSVSLFDIRNPSAPVRSYIDSHTDTITRLAFHPSQPSVLLSGSTDGLVSLFDTTHADEDDALQQVLNPRSAVHCAGFLSPQEVYVVTTDEQLSIYNLSSDTPGSAREVGDVRPLLNCSYVVDLLTSALPPAMVVGEHEAQSLSILPLDESRGWAFGPRVELPGAHGEEVVRDLLLLHREGRAVSCGEDGKVKAWDLGGAGR